MEIEKKTLEKKIRRTRLIINAAEFAIIVALAFASYYNPQHSNEINWVLIGTFALGGLLTWDDWFVRAGVLHNPLGDKI